MKEKLGEGAEDRPCIFVFHGGSGSSEEDISTAVKVCTRLASARLYDVKAQSHYLGRSGRAGSYSEGIGSRWPTLGTGNSGEETCSSSRHEIRFFSLVLRKVSSRSS